MAERQAAEWEEVGKTVLFDIPPLKKVRNGLEGIYKSDVFG
jgi:hypothetical protein